MHVYSYWRIQYSPKYLANCGIRSNYITMTQFEVNWYGALSIKETPNRIVSLFNTLGLVSVFFTYYIENSNVLNTYRLKLNWIYKMEATNSDNIKRTALPIFRTLHYNSNHVKYFNNCVISTTKWTCYIKNSVYLGRRENHNS